MHMITQATAAATTMPTPARITIRWNRPIFGNVGSAPAGDNRARFQMDLMRLRRQLRRAHAFANHLRKEIDYFGKREAETGNS